MNPTSYLRLLPVLLILAEDSLTIHHSDMRKPERLHPKHLVHRTLTGYASAQLEEVGNLIVTPLASTSTSKQSETSETATRASSPSSTSNNKDYVQDTYNSNTKQAASVKGVNVSIGVGISTSVSGYYPTTYNLKSESSGINFFDAWDFFTDADPTHGLVAYQSADSSWKSGLVSVRKNSLSGSASGTASDTIKNYPLTARMQVDSTTWLKDGQSRKSVRLTSKARFKYGLLILDAVKMPYGCSTWPAFWTVGDDWPTQGEIDIVEGVNMLKKNQMTLHTSPGCLIKKQMGRNATGDVYGTDCDAAANYNAGCGVGDPDPASYGKGFNDGGGGVFAMEWNSNGISIWRFPRSAVPSDIMNKQPNPKGWSRPVAFWDSAQCGAMREQFGQHRVVFDITVCGDWAGSAAVFGASGCSGSCAEAVKDPSNFAQAEWEIASVQLYQ
ncbi:hypothetical protein CROQUDRAFT_66126 [Cronartium quercuum f. sp. fusiforme G11]|uniref:GH16 domain-containing protein n=1 Tax=Cronartium quercuum f. sp. fusiforme G11 TaxID=708437 RepID=A0A9P6NCQ7_9BASI|nr:hypothetical protein CROQUDRAFT_66126 [Cronartium quercuum f. sp. fusiforme G11]